MINYLKRLCDEYATKSSEKWLLHKIEKDLEKDKHTHKTFFDKVTVTFFDGMMEPEEYDFKKGFYSVNASDGFVTIYCQETPRWVRSINQTAVSSIEIDEAYRFVDEEIEY